MKRLANLVFKIWFDEDAEMIILHYFTKSFFTWYNQFTTTALKCI